MDIAEIKKLEKEILEGYKTRTIIHKITSSIGVEKLNEPHEIKIEKSIETKWLTSDSYIRMFRLWGQQIAQDEYDYVLKKIIELIKQKKPENCKHIISLDLKLIKEKINKLSAKTDLVAIIPQELFIYLSKEKESILILQYDHESDTHLLDGIPVYKARKEILDNQIILIGKDEIRLFYNPSSGNEPIKIEIPDTQEGHMIDVRIMSEIELEIVDFDNMAIISFDKL